MASPDHPSERLRSGNKGARTPLPKARSYTPARIAWGLLLLLGLYLGTCAAIAWKTVCPQRRQLAITPSRYAMPFDVISFRSSDATHLAGWFIPAQGKPRGVIILCHGVNDTREAMLYPAQILHQRDYACFLFDFRTRGESGGSVCTLGYRETDDLLAAVGYVRSRLDMHGVPLGVMGRSMGGAVALMGTARDPHIRAVIAESPFAQLDHAIHNNFQSKFGSVGPLLGIPTRWIGERLVGVNCADVSPVTEIKRIAPRPVLLIQDADDTLCPPEETRVLYMAAGEPKSVWTVPHAGHVQAAVVQPEEFKRHILAFFDTHLK